MIMIGLYTVKQPLSKRPQISFQYQLLLNGSQKGNILQGEHSAIRLTFIKLPFVIKIYVLSILEWPFYTDFTVPQTHGCTFYFIYYNNVNILS